MGGLPGLLQRLEHRDLSIKLPKLYGLAVNELPCALLGGFLVFADQVYPAFNVPVRAHHVRAVLLHRSSLPGFYAALKIPDRPVGATLKNIRRTTDKI
jgi:hypothetical protein